MFRFAGLFSVSATTVLACSIPVAFAQPTQAQHDIFYNKQLMSSPYGLVRNHTTYMPIWYVENALKKAGISANWSHGIMYFNTSDHGSLVRSQGHGKNAIDINGIPVERVNAIVAKDPSDHKNTTYMPIWYVMQALKQMNIQSKWDGTSWFLTGSAKVKQTTSPQTLPYNPENIVRDIKNTKSLPVLKSGSSGIFVLALQQTMIQLGYLMPSDSNYSSTVASQVKSYQSNHHLPQTGIVNPATWTSIQASLKYATEHPVAAPPPQTQSSGGTSGSASTPSTPPPATSGSNPGSLAPGQTTVPPFVPPTIPVVPSSNAPSFTKVDLRYPAPGNINANSINAYLQAHDSPMYGLGSTFIQSQNIYGVDANYLVSHAILESYWGKSQIARQKNNLYGYGAYDSAPGVDAGFFPSNRYAILFQGWEVRNNYLNPGSSEYVSPTLNGMNVHYATDAQWAHSIGGLMRGLAASTNDTVSAYHMFNGTTTAPPPASTAEPTFHIANASAIVKASPYYHSAPYFSSPSEGAHEEFGSPIKRGSAGTDVAQVQRQLNQDIGAGLKVDGQFGAHTETAVKRYEKQKGLPVTGTWTFAMWNQNHAISHTIAPGTKVSISEIKMGMLGNYVVEWDKVSGYGWVAAPQLMYQNVYRAIVAKPSGTDTNIQIYDASHQQVIETVHSGTFVVSSSPGNQNGWMKIEICNQKNGQIRVGDMPASAVSLQQIQ